MDLAGTEQAGACGWALNEGFKSGTISKREDQAKWKQRTCFRTFPKVARSWHRPWPGDARYKHPCGRRIHRLNQIHNSSAAKVAFVLAHISSDKTWPTSWMK